MDLWTEASIDHEAMAHQAALDAAEVELSAVFPFLAAARSAAEYQHRRALAEDRLTAIALRYGLDPEDILKTADRRYQLILEALMEGQDPLQQEVADCATGSGFGSGPEKPLEHTEGPDFSHGYSEVPQGAPGGPDPRVCMPEQTGPSQVQEATGALHTACSACSCGTGKKGKCKGCGKKSCACGPSSPCGGMGKKASADPVRQQVLAVTASIKATNPALGDEEAGRLARQVVGRYLTADLSGSIVSDNPAAGGHAGDASGNSGPGFLTHMLEGQGLKSMLPGAGGDAAGAGAGAGELAELAPLAAL